MSWWATAVLPGHPLGCGDSLLQLSTTEHPPQSPERLAGLDLYFNLLKLLFCPVFLGSQEEVLVCGAHWQACCPLEENRAARVSPFLISVINILLHNLVCLILGQ